MRYFGSRKKKKKARKKEKLFDKQVDMLMWTDGSSLVNPGPSGYGSAVVKNGMVTTYSGGFKHGTNNIAEMRAVSETLKQYKPCSVLIITDSMYVIHGLARLAKGTLPITNIEEWEDMKDVINGFTIYTRWTKGHAKDPFNIICDELASIEANKQKDLYGVKNETKNETKEAIIPPTWI